MSSCHSFVLSFSLSPFPSLSLRVCVCMSCSIQACSLKRRHRCYRCGALQFTIKTNWINKINSLAWKEKPTEEREIIHLSRVYLLLEYFCTHFDSHNEQFAFRSLYNNSNMHVYWINTRYTSGYNSRSSFSCTHFSLLAHTKLSSLRDCIFICTVLDFWCRISIKMLIAAYVFSKAERWHDDDNDDDDDAGAGAADADQSLDQLYHYNGSLRLQNQIHLNFKMSYHCGSIAVGPFPPSIQWVNSWMNTSSNTFLLPCSTKFSTFKPQNCVNNTYIYSILFVI